MNYQINITQLHANLYLTIIYILLLNWSNQLQHVQIEDSTYYLICQIPSLYHTSALKAGFGEFQHL